MHVLGEINGDSVTSLQTHDTITQRMQMRLSDWWGNEGWITATTDSTCSNNSAITLSSVNLSGHVAHLTIIFSWMFTTASVCMHV